MMLRPMWVISSRLESESESVIVKRGTRMPKNAGIY
jgi:hypothetical protein